MSKYIQNNVIVVYFSTLYSGLYGWANPDSPEYFNIEGEIDSIDNVEKYIPILFDNNSTYDILFNFRNTDKINSEFVFSLLDFIAPYNKTIKRKNINLSFEYEKLNKFENFLDIVQRTHELNGRIKITLRNFNYDIIQTCKMCDIVYRMIITKDNEDEIYNKFLDHYFNTINKPYSYQLSYENYIDNDFSYSKLYNITMKEMCNYEECKTHPTNIGIDFVNNNIIKCVNKLKCSPRVELTKENLIDVINSNNDIFASSNMCNNCRLLYCDKEILNNY